MNRCDREGSLHGHYIYIYRRRWRFPVVGEPNYAAVPQNADRRINTAQVFYKHLSSLTELNCLFTCYRLKAKTHGSDSAAATSSDKGSRGPLCRSRDAASCFSGASAIHRRHLFGSKQRRRCAARLIQQHSDSHLKARGTDISLVALATTLAQQRRRNQLF